MSAYHNSCVLPLIVAFAAVVAGCVGSDNKEFVDNVNPETTPTITTVNVSTLISDSGVVRYRLTAPIWYIYDERREPCWTFPQSLHLERYDEFFNKEATVDADSATYFKDRQLWRLDGHVKVVNMVGEKFLTPQLFWDERKQTVYSDSFIQVIRADRIMEGHGFESDQRMSRFNVRNVSAILPVQQFRGSNNGDSVSSASPDSAAVAPEHQVRPTRRTATPSTHKKVQ